VSYQVFARKYRPETFKDVLGQDHVIQTLRNAIEQNRLAHAYLFVGPRGTGKTTTARILAKALNCPDGPSADFDPENSICKEIANGTSLDVIEIDGASNNGVDHIRDLRENVQYTPTHGKFKIYYIDEVHMLSTSAFNALLKTLEEPPEHVKFIFATTEPNKILPTIISRCQRFDLRPIDTKTIADQLTYIANNENVSLDSAAAWAVAKGADGGMRDAQSMLDQLVAFCGSKIKEEDVLNVFGFTSRETIAALTQNILEKNTSGALGILNEQADAGKELSQLLDDAISCLRALLVAKVDPNASNDGIPQKLWESLSLASKSVPTDRLLHLVDIFADTEARMKWASNKKLHFEIGVIKAIQSLNDARISDVIAALAGAGTLEPTQLEAIDSVQTKAPTPPVPKPQKAPTPEPTPEPVAEAPAAKPQPTPPQPEAVATTTTPEPEPIVEQPAKVEDPPPPAPSQKAALQETFTPEPLKKRTANETISGLDAFIDSAPETSNAPPILEPDAVVTAKQKAAPKKEAAEPESAKIDDNEFYKDPLIQKALEVFSATLKSA
jgi:DNA polymerase III subunit gamma/tau